MSLMADDLSDEQKRNRNLHVNQPYDESLELPDSEEVTSQYTPTPRVGIHKDNRSDICLKNKMSDESDDEIQTGAMSSSGPEQPVSSGAKGPKPYNEEEEENETESEDDDDDDEDDEEEEERGAVEGAYNPADYENLPVTPEIKELFQYITRYTPQSIELEHRLKPFIPDFIPAVGDIDAFIKVPRHDGKPDSLGLIMLDEPCAKQSDQTVLDLKLRSVTKQSNVSKVAVKSLENASQNPKSIESWIKNIGELHRTKPPPNVHYSKNMPDIDQLMQEWPPEFEEVLNEVVLPTAELECDLPQYADIVCGILDIPVYKSRIQSLHLLFSVFSEFKNSQHFQAMSADNTKMTMNGNPGKEVADRFEL